MESFTSNFVSQILYPEGEFERLTSNAFLIGWNLDNFKCCIAAAVVWDPSKLMELENVLRSCYLYQPIIFSACASREGSCQPIVLGEWVHNIDLDYFPSTERQSEGIWLTLTKSGLSDPTPKLHSLYSLGCAYQTSCYFFRYCRPDTLNLECTHVGDSRNIFFTSGPDEDVKRAEREVNVMVAQINSVQDLTQIIDLQHQTKFPPNTQWKRIWQKIDSRRLAALRAVLSCCGFIWFYFIGKLLKVLQFPLTLTVATIWAQWLGLHNLIGDFSNQSGGKGGFTTLSLSNFSLTAAFLVENILRAQGNFRKCALFPYTWQLAPSVRQTIWMEVMSNMLCSLFDMLFGYLFTGYIISHVEEISHYTVLVCDQFQVHFIMNSLTWFQNSPFGLKLNPVIIKYIGLLLYTALQQYNRFILTTRFVHIPVLKIIAYAGSVGFTLQIAIIVDILRVISVHIALIHRLFNNVHLLQIKTIYALYLLFQGRIVTLLYRFRVDPMDYDHSQLLLGVVACSIVLFLFPSVAVYYYLFALAQLVVVTVQYCLWLAAIIVKEFPYCTLLMYLWHPRILAHGVQFNILEKPHISSRPHVQLEALSLQNLTNAGREALDQFRSGVAWTARRAQQLAERAREIFSRTSTISSDFPLTIVTAEDSAPLLEKGSRDGSPKIKGILKPSSKGMRQSSAQQTSPLSIINPKAMGVDLAEGGMRGSQVHFEGEAESPTSSLVYSSESASPVDTMMRSFADSGSMLRFGLPSITSEAFSSFRLEGGDNLMLRRGMHSPLGIGPTSASATSPVSVSPGVLGAKIGSVYFVLHSKVGPVTKILSSYMPYIMYAYTEKGIVSRLLRGIFYGVPALDVQLIHTSLQLHVRRIENEQRFVNNVMEQAAAVLSSYSLHIHGSMDADEAESIAEMPSKRPSVPVSQTNIKQRKQITPKRLIRETSAMEDADASKKLATSGYLNFDETQPLAHSGGSDDGFKHAFASIYDLPELSSHVTLHYWDVVRAAVKDSADLVQNVALISHFEGGLEQHSNSRFRVKQRRWNLLLLLTVLLVFSMNALSVITNSYALFSSRFVKVKFLYVLESLDRSSFGIVRTAHQGKAGKHQIQNNITTVDGKGTILSVNSTRTIDLQADVTLNQLAT